MTTLFADIYSTCIHGTYVHLATVKVYTMNDSEDFEGANTLNGLTVAVKNGIVEITDDDNNLIEEKVGKIIFSNI